jgi:hypothetical protein
LRFAIAHQTEGRTRLRALVRPVDTVELLALADGVGGLSGVDAVDCRTTTGSLVIEHPEHAWEEIEDQMAQFGVVVALADMGHGHVDGLAPVRATIGQVDGLMTRLTAGGVDMRTLSFVLMLGLALRQMMRGQVMVPAFSFLWYASEILLKARLGAGDPGDTAAD